MPAVYALIIISLISLYFITPFIMSFMYARIIYCPYLNAHAMPNDSCFNFFATLLCKFGKRKKLFKGNYLLPKITMENDVRVERNYVGVFSICISLDEG